MFQVAAASWERAVFAVQTNTTRRMRCLGPGPLCQRQQGLPDDRLLQAKLDIAAPPVALGTDAPDHARVLEDAQVVGEQIGAQSELVSKLAGRRIPEHELVGDGETYRFAEGSEDSGPHVPISAQFISTHIESSMVDPCRESTAPSCRSARRLLAESLGTGLLVTVVVGSGIAAARLSPDDVGLQLLENSMATVFGLAVLILIFGPVSGAHFNPVVSAADWWLGRRRSGWPGDE